MRKASNSPSCSAQRDQKGKVLNEKPITSNTEIASTKIESKAEKLKRITSLDALVPKSGSSNEKHKKTHIRPYETKIFETKNATIISNNSSLEVKRISLASHRILPNSSPLSQNKLIRKWTHKNLSSQEATTLDTKNASGLEINNKSALNEQDQLSRVPEIDLPPRTTNRTQVGRILSPFRKAALISCGSRASLAPKSCQNLGNNSYVF